MTGNRNRVLMVLATALVVFAGTALGSYAANGGPLLLGKGNKAAKTTKLKNAGKGPALSLKTKVGEPPLMVSSSTKVAGLNADLVDGLEGTALQNQTYLSILPTATAVTSYRFAFPTLPPGTYLVSYSVYAEIGGGGQLFCDLRKTPLTAPIVLASAGGNFGGSSTPSASGVVDTSGSPSPNFHLACTPSAGTFTVTGDADFRSQISFLRLDSVVPSLPTAAVP